MTNTLTWDIKPIQLPKINANLLSVVALILICAMSFLIVSPAIAAWCIKEHLAVAAARVTVELAEAAVALAETLLDLADEGDEIVLAIIALAAAHWALNEADLAYDNALDDLDECQNPPSGSCDS